MMRACILYLCIILLSCQQKAAEKYVDETSALDASVQTAVSVDTGRIAKRINESTGNSAPEPPTSNQSVRLLFTGVFHGDEVEVGVDRLPWFGLFPTDSGDFVLQATTLVAKRVVDGLLDDEASGEMTGWEISTATAEDPLMLVWQKDLAEGFVDGLEIPSTLYPGDSVHIQFLGVQYLLNATGSTQSQSYGTTVSDYSLHLSRTENGVTISKTLVSHAAFDDAMTSILWSGDLDRDGYLDLLIDMSNHYNRIAPTLFLSKPAGPKDPVAQVAQHSSVGC